MARFRYTINDSKLRDMLSITGSLASLVSLF
jgi:hypothetical protein